MHAKNRQNVFLEDLLRAFAIEGTVSRDTANIAMIFIRKMTSIIVRTMSSAEKNA